MKPPSPPHITVSAPLIAPRLPPETGASTKPMPRPRGGLRQLARDRAPRRSCGRRRSRRASCPAKAPSAPTVIERRSSSLPTQANTSSAPAAAGGRRGGAGAAMRLHPFGRLGGGAVVDRHLVAGARPGGRPSGSPSPRGRGRRRCARERSRRSCAHERERPRGGRSCSSGWRRFTRCAGARCRR